MSPQLCVLTKSDVIPGPLAYINVTEASLSQAPRPYQVVLSPVVIHGWALVMLCLVYVFNLSLVQNTASIIILNNFKVKSSIGLHIVEGVLSFIIIIVIVMIIAFTAVVKHFGSTFFL